MKVVINRCFGGFGLSDAAFEALLNLKGIEWEKTNKPDAYTQHYYRKGQLDIEEAYLSPYDFVEDRAEPDLIKVIELMGEEANSIYSELKIVEIPDDVKWHIHEYDGMEHIAEDHRTWY